MQAHLVTLTAHEKSCAAVAQTLISLLQPATGHLLHLRSGATRVALPWQAQTGRQAGELGLPVQVLRRFGLRAGQKVHLLLQGGVWRLGPLVGVLAPCRRGQTKPYGAQSTFFRRLILASKEMGVPVFVFDFHEIKWTDKRVRGYTFNGAHWEASSYPLPDVVYDRATGSFLGGTPMADVARRRLTRSLGVKIFNTRLGGKMRLYRLMRADPVLVAHLPATYRATSGERVAKALAVNGSAYLKPDVGGQGKGIVRLRRRGGGWEYTLVTGDYARVHGQAAQLAGIMASLRQRVRLCGYLVQPDVHLLRLHGRICDVRALIQRDQDGCWHLTGAVVRAGQPGTIISNLHGGGQAIRLEKVLSAALPGEEAASARVQAQIEELALRVGAALDKGTECLGELGVDLGIDRHGKVWVIEANSRTGRAVFRRAGQHELAREADRRPLRFAAYLAGFTVGEASAGASPTTPPADE